MFLGLKLSIISPSNIIKWTLKKVNNTIQSTEITEPTTINIFTGKPLKSGLFCETLFGPLISFRCYCNNSKIDSLYCSICNIELIHNKIRNERLGFIKLSTPIIHLWYLTGPLPVLPILLESSKQQITDLVYYTIFFNEQKPIQLNSSIYKLSKFIFINYYLYNLLLNLNILTEIIICKNLLVQPYLTTTKQLSIYKKLKLLHNFYINNINPSWIFLTVLPVIPPGLRPFYKDPKTGFISSSLNKLYKLILIRNNRLSKWISMRSKINILYEILEKKLLQESIDQLFSFTTTKITTNSFITFNKILSGKLGYIRNNLVGKRLDFSGRSVISSSPDLQLNKVGLPYNLIFTLFKPMLYKLLKKSNKLSSFLPSIKSKLKLSNTFMLLLNKILIKELILLNRAPTLHRMNLQSFNPIMTEGYTFNIYPLICKSFNADFDGDQMGIFLILTDNAKKEASTLLYNDKNIFSPASGSLNFKLTNEMYLGLQSLLLLSYQINPKINIFPNYYTFLQTGYNILLYSKLYWIRYIYQVTTYQSIIYLLTNWNRILLTQL